MFKSNRSLSPDNLQSNIPEYDNIPSKKFIKIEFDMNNPHLGFEKPVVEKPCVGTQVLPLAPPLPTLQQGPPSMTRLANSSQGGRLQVRSSPTSILSDSPMMTNLQPPSQERCALLCYLQANGHLSDFSPWRSRLPIVPLQTFLKSNKLDTGNDGEDLYKLLQSQNHSLLQSALTGNRQVALSVEVPRSKLSIYPGSLQMPSWNPTAFLFSLVVKPRHPWPASWSFCQSEAYVMQRVGELQKDGLWPEKRLPKVHELPRAKAHWDYLLEEMAWLAADFAQERKWKKAAAKKCARMVQKHFQEKEALVQKAIKAQEMQLKRIASFIAKEIKQFWTNVEKLVEFKQQTRLEEKRKKALDQHLSFIVDQTEKYSSLVAESMNTSRPSSPKHHSDDEFEPEDPSDDDEETIAKEEALSANDEKCDNQDEVDVLKRESELPLEDLLSSYLAQRDSISTPLSMDEDGEDDDMEYQDSGDSSDDEETILEQEKTEGTVDYKQEIDDLKEEGNMSIDQLKAKYGIQQTPESLPTNGDSISQRARKRKEVVNEESDEGSEEDSEDEVSEEDESSSTSDKEDSPLKALINDSHHVEVEGSQDKDKEINDVAAIAESLQPKGNTLSSTSVVTKVPFLLKHLLREYQHIGLDWLVTMYDRKLNGILADEMGLGKTIQTIALIAHLACEKGNWGPHLIIVPTSVMLNWEMEFKKWCPAFKILTYYGTQKERKMKRSGWTKPNAFHICITSYKLVIQDHQSFRRKKWKYLILDEAQNIKNFKSQRWQLLLNFQTQRTKETLASGSLLSVINVLMQLRKVCNHPNLFEVRPTVSPFQMDSLEYHVPSLVWSALEYDPFKHVDLVFLNLRIIEFELWLLAFVAHRARKYKVNPEYISSIDSAPPDPPPCPKGRVKINIKKRILPQPPQVSSPVRPLVQVSNNHRVTSFPTKVGTSPLIKLGQNASQGVTLRLANPSSGQIPNYLQLLQPGGMKVMTTTGQRLTVVSKQGSNVAKLVNPTSVTQINSNRPIMRVPPLNITSAATVVQNSLTTANNSPVSISEPTQGNGSTPNSLPSPKKVTRQSTLNTSKNKEESNPYEDLKDEYLENLRKKRRKEKLELIARVNEVRCQALPIYGSDLLSSLTLDEVPDENKDCIGTVHCRNALSPNPLLFWNQTHALTAAIHSIEDRVAELSDIFSRFVLYVPAVSSQPVRLHVPHPPPSKMFKEEKRLSLVETWLRPKLRLLHSISSAMSTQFPDRRLIQYDCGKLQSLDKLLRRLKADHHRILIFTQMTRMLDVLEAFLNFHGHIYLRLDGTTKVDQRQSTIQDLFNVDTSENDASRRMAEVLHNNDKTAQNAEDTQVVANSDEKVAIGALESAMAQAEDESDVAAAKVAKAEAAAELAEFDENIPIETHDGVGGGQEMSKAELELHNLMQQLTAVERYAMKFMEENDAAWSKEQLAAAEAEIEQQKKEWEAGRLAALQGRKSPSGEAESESVLTYSGVDSRNQVNKTRASGGGGRNCHSGNNVEEGTPRTRSHGRVSIDLWTLDDSPQNGGKPLSGQNRKFKTGKRRTTPPPPNPTPPPYSNPNLVIRTRRASAASINEISKVSKKVSRLSKTKRPSDVVPLTISTSLGS
ncbi:unnamed protein product [Nezara viridula]|uniref:Helicase domino n=1 Tax=Nezara viridula TaxID=85310 RepID=A0A9P0HGK2_NEZVI|nr:unnamed protein product [Nezara viridula]